MMMNPVTLSVYFPRWKAKLSRYKLVRFCNPSINFKWFPFIGFHSAGNFMFSFQSGVTMAVLHLYWHRTPHHLHNVLSDRHSFYLLTSPSLTTTGLQSSPMGEIIILLTPDPIICRSFRAWKPHLMP